MEVRKGYKQTEVGIIPKDWEVRKLGECLLKNPDYGLNAPSVKYSDILPTYLRITDISEDGKFLHHGKTSVNNPHSDKYFLEINDLVFARTGASVGKTYLYDPDDGDLVFAGFLIRVKVNPSRLIAHYFKGILETAYYWNWVKTMSTRSGQPGINGSEYSQLLIPLPPTTAEQTAIAAFLSDTDALIISLEKLIVKKQNIKQGAMQQLLTGKKRLTGFTEQWETMTIKQLNLDISDGNYSSKYPKQSDFTEIGIPFIRANNIKDMKIIDHDMRYISKGLHNELQKGHLKQDDILITTRGEIGQVAVVLDKFIDSNINAQIVRINTDRKIDHKYLAYFLAQKNTQKQIKALETGSALKQLPVGRLIQLLIKYPSYPEQTAIAQVLSNMDEEIQALEKKLAKYRLITQGMMQELLTGKTRLV